MKKIIINKSQLLKLNEDVFNVAAPTTGTTIEAYIDAVKKARPEATKAKQLGVNTNIVVSNTENDMGNNAPTLVATGDDLTTAANTIPDSAYQNGVNVQFSPEATNECKTFTKKLMEEIRLNNMRRTGEVLTKKKLQEKFLK
jgi:hypothetical protein